MIVQFKSVRLYNFCSYVDAEINLLDRGFCLVSGRNNCKKDNALSNGSGKSTIWSAICYALTGETLTGIKNNLKNINTSEDVCFVVLDFSVDSDNYTVTRFCSPKNDLKIIKNDIDISGKGVRESEKILSENVPDLTKDLIASTILLGQGMPNRFSSFSPSGRKDLLEKLTKSDFMIDDIKARISARTVELNEQLRGYEDSLLVNNTQLSSASVTLESAKKELNTMNTQNFSALIPETEKRMTDLAEELKKYENIIKTAETDIEQVNNKFLTLTAEKAKTSNEEFTNYTAAYNNIIKEIATITAEMQSVNIEISKLENIKDICPTCGQKIPGILKPDTSEQRKKAQELQIKKSAAEIKQAEICSKHKYYIEQIDEQYSELTNIQQDIKNKKSELLLAKQAFDKLNIDFNKEKEYYTELLYDKESHERVFKAIKNKVDELELQVNQLENTIKIITLAKAKIDEHIAVIKKIDLLVKRDFRGYLLSNIIEYLNNKAKEYSKVVFDNTELNIYLDGNALDISYCGKLYESLSGGEKQRVDLITQFAIRELLQTYFNYSSNILVLDEITDNLDRIATTKVFDLITDKLKDVESIFIISHHDSELEIPVDSELQVIKDENSNSSVKEN